MSVTAVAVGEPAPGDTADGAAGDRCGTEVALREESAVSISSGQICSVAKLWIGCVDQRRARRSSYRKQAGLAVVVHHAKVDHEVGHDREYVRHGEAGREGDERQRTDRHPWERRLGRRRHRSALEKLGLVERVSSDSDAPAVANGWALAAQHHRLYSGRGVERGAVRAPRSTARPRRRQRPHRRGFGKCDLH